MFLKLWNFIVDFVKKLFHLNIELKAPKPVTNIKILIGD